MNRRPSVSPVDDYSEDREQDVMVFERAQSAPVESRLRGRQRFPRLSRERAGAPKGHGSSRVPAVGTVWEASDEMEAVYLDLQSAKIGSSIRQILARTSFPNSSNNLLHYVASKDEARLLDCIIEHFSNNNWSIDVPNEASYTPLEIAVQTGRTNNVRLLLQAGASPKKRHDKGQSLHTAVSTATSPEICDALLRHGADVEGRQHEDTECTHTPLVLAWGKLWSVPAPGTEERLCMIIEILLDYGAKADFDSRLERAEVLTFVHSWIVWQKLNVHSTSSQTLRLWHLLGSDFNPVCWFPRRYCPANECSSFASLIFNHTAGSGLSGRLIDCSDHSKYGEDLVRALVTSCSKRAASISDIHVSDLLANLLGKLMLLGLHANQNHDLVRIILEKSSTKDQAALFHVLLTFDFVNAEEKKMIVDWVRAPDEATELKARVREIGNDQGLMQLFEKLLGDHDLDLPMQRVLLQALPDLKESLRFRLAESLLMPKNGLMSIGVYQKIITQYLEQDNAGHSDHQSFWNKVLHDLGLDDSLSSLQNERNERIVQCIIHVLTKLMLEQPIPGVHLSGRRQVTMALGWRSDNRLPSVSITSSALIETMNLHRTGQVSPSNSNVSNEDDSSAHDKSDRAWRAKPDH